MTAVNIFTNISYNDDSNLEFFRSYRKMAHSFGCYYMGYIIEDRINKKRAGFTTNMPWGREYLNNFISECHLWNEVQKFYNEEKYSSLILPWETVPATTSLQKDIILRREELGIGSNGISFCKKIGSQREYYYFAPEINHKSFIKQANTHISLIKEEISTFRNASLGLLANYPE